jgi:hypothetical protein
MKLKISRLKQNYRAALWKWLAEGEACDLGAARKLLVAPVEQTYPMKEHIEVVDVLTAVRWVTEQEQNNG